MPQLPALPYLSLLTFLPVVGMLIIAFIKRDNVAPIRWVSAGITGLQLILAIIVFVNYNTGLAGVNDPKSFQLIEQLPWIRVTGLGIFGNISIDYFMAVDGLSITMVLLTALISFIGSVASYSINKNEKGYFLMYLLLCTGMMGVFCALDFFLFFIFWELMLLPMYFLIGIWGGPRREYAAIKFFIYTLLGSVVMLLAMIGLYASTAVAGIDAATGKATTYHTFNMIAMMDPANHVAGTIFDGFGTAWRYAGYLALFFAFAIKIPMIPFHTWLPDAHVEAPTAISLVLAGVLLKMGTYGILRVCYGMFPEVALDTSQWLAWFGFANIIYGALCAMAQKDLKRLVAYSSISHMGYVMLGLSAINTQGISGGILQMFNHGTITAMLFLIVGVIYDRAQTRGVNEFGGLANQMPKLFAISIVAFFAALGLPALSAFVSEAFILLGAFQVHQLITILSTLGIVLTAAYILWTLQRMFLGVVPERWNALPDVNNRELATLLPLAAIVIFLGIYPGPMLDLMTASVNKLVTFVHTVGVQATSVVK